MPRRILSRAHSRSLSRPPGFSLPRFLAFLASRSLGVLLLGFSLLGFSLPWFLAGLVSRSLGLSLSWFLALSGFSLPRVLAFLVSPPSVSRSVGISLRRYLGPSVSRSVSRSLAFSLPRFLAPSVSRSRSSGFSFSRSPALPVPRSPGSRSSLLGSRSANRRGRADGRLGPTQARSAMSCGRRGSGGVSEIRCVCACVCTCVRVSERASDTVRNDAGGGWWVGLGTGLGGWTAAGSYGSGQGARGRCPR